MANRWFVTLEGREVGPLDPPQVKQLVALGRIRPDTPIRREDLARPVPAGTVKGLLPPPDEASTVAIPQRDTVSTQTTERTLRPVPQEQRATAPDLLEVAVADPRTTELSPVAGIRATEPSPVMFGTPDPTPPARRAGTGGGSGIQRPRAPAPAEPDDDLETIDATVEDTEGPARASFGVRLAATLIDGAVIGAVTAVLWILAFMYLIGAEAAVLRDEQARRDGLAAKAGFPIPGLAEFDLAKPGLEAAIADARSAVAEAQAALDATKPPPDAAGKRPKPPDTAQEEYRLGLAKGKLEEAEGRLKFITQVHENGLRIVEEKTGAKVRFGMLMLVMALFLSFIATPVQEGAFGTTLGKRLLGWRVATMTGRSVGIGKALLRHLVRMIPFGQFAALGAERQALHDSLTGTQVIPRSVPPPRTGKQRTSATSRPVTGAVAKPGAGSGTRPARRR
ncbi:MAG: hypothetical protein RLZZ127_2818 [Planctomycetota bacterium]|jgi:uncharacterized RDD family membrane protein YckC